MILSIITIAIAPRISGHLAQARDTKRQMDLRQIGAALELYRNNHGNYPGFAGMIAADGSFSDDDNTYQISPVTLALSGLVKEGYITSLPKDPSSNNGIRVFDGLFTHNNSEKGVLQRGEYGYMPLKNGSYILIAQTETEDKSNWIWNSSREGYGNPLRI